MSSQESSKYDSLGIERFCDRPLLRGGKNVITYWPWSMKLINVMVLR